MPLDKTDGTIRHTRLQNESREYLERREELRRAEVELIVQSEKLAALRAHARARGWRRLRLLSAGDSTFKYDLRSEDAEGRQDSATSVFTLGADGTIRHFYTNHPWLADDMDERGEDLTIPVYNLLDLTPAGRGNFYARLDYGVDVHWGAYPPTP